MVEIKLSLAKDVNANANDYYSKSKKLKAKIDGINEIISLTEKEIKELESKKDEYINKRETKKKLKAHRKKEWFDNFRSTYTSGGFLVVLGKDATSNEVLIKKHMEENDLVFHTETPGSPFGIVKDGKDKLSKEEVNEVATVVASFSKQWKRGFGNADAFYVNSDQVTKKANTGEYMSKGSFMVRGKKNIIKNVNLRICLGVKLEKVEINEEEVEILDLFSGSEEACKKYCNNRGRNYKRRFWK